jgi:hypothetical protein
LYRLTIRPIQALLHDTISLSELWHRRLAHIHYRALPALGKMVIGLPKIQIQHKGICKGCARRKNVKGSFLSNDNRSKEILDLIHSDVCGPMTVASLNGYLYYVPFIDDHSRKTWIYFLKNKDGVLAKFQEFKAQVENLNRRKIKVLRSNNGGELPPNISAIFVLMLESIGSFYNPLQPSAKWGCKEEKQNYHRGNQSDDT